jgi:hypothetical protein
MNKTIKELQSTIKELKAQSNAKENTILIDTLSSSIDKLENQSKENTKQREQLFDFLYGGHSWSKVKSVFTKDFRGCKNQDEVLDLYNKYVPYIWFNRALSTSLKTYTDLRNIIKECDTRNTTYALTHVFSIGDADRSKGIFAYREKKTAENVLKRVEENTTEFTIDNVKEVVNNLRDYVDNFDKKLEDKKISKASSAKVDIIKAYYISFLLGLVTGRRQVELLKTLEVGSKKGKATFRGLSKPSKEDREKEAKGIKVVKDGSIIFMSVKDVQKYLRLLRKLLPTEDLTNAQVNKKYNAMFNKAFKERLINSEINITKDGNHLFSNNDAKFHKLRTAYALTNYKMAVEAESKKSEDKRIVINKSKFIADVLNQTWKMNASEHYDSKL